MVRDTALHLLQLLDKRFFCTIGPLVEGDTGELLQKISAIYYYRFAYT